MDDQLDVVIVGGGISGLGIAVQSARAGFRTALVEAGVFGGHTSSASLRIMHGGLRYLQTLDIGRSLRSIRAQGIIASRYRDLVEPMPCLLPASNGLKAPWSLAAAAALYRLLGFRWGTRAGYLSASSVRNAYPAYAEHFPRGALRWIDYQLRDPQELFVRLLHEFSSAGGTALSHTRVTQVVCKGNQYLSNCAGGHGVFTLTSRVVVNAAGPWLETVRSSVIGKELSKFRRADVSPGAGWCEGWNICCAGELPHRVAVAIPAIGGDPRFHFVVPRKSGFAVGTDYRRVSAISGQGSDEITEQEQAALRHSAQRLVNGNVSVLSLERGVLPSADSQPSSVQPLGHERVLCSGGYIEVLSTKFTTFIPQGEEVLRAVRHILRS